MQLHRVYICYLVSTFLISAFVYNFILINLQNMRKYERLRKEMDDIADFILHSPYNGEYKSKYITDLVDNLIKMRLADIWYDLYSIKKQLKCRDSATATAQATNIQLKLMDEKREDRVNYASEELGAKISHVKAVPICGKNILKSWLGLEFKTNPPISMLRSGMEPGNCFGFRNSSAEVTIDMPIAVIIYEILIQHITKKQSPTSETSSAPKNFQVFGKKDNLQFNLGSFEFSNNQSVEYFNIITNEKFQSIIFQFSSNHGNPNHTCVYRIAVFGKL